MNKDTNWLLEAGLATGLGLALLLVIGLDRLLPQAQEAPPEIITTTTTEETTQQMEAKPLRMAMTPSTFDPKFGKLWEDMAELLASLGEGYQYDNLQITDLLNQETLAKYDILFFTCGQEFNQEFRLQNNLREFVNKGGTLYASDWRYECIKYSFPEYHKPELAADGYAGSVTATVRDQGLRDVFGQNVQLHFELPQWKSAAFGGPGVEALLWGQFRKQPFPGQFPQQQQFVEAPLLVRFHHGKGTVIFTSFHNERANTDTSRKLLKYLVFHVVTAKETASVTQSLVKGGFSPTKSNLMSASANAQKVTQTFQHNQPGKLRFVLAFNPGAKLRLEVEGPGGQKYDHTDTATFDIEVPDAPLGEWRYTVTALQVPHSNFPFTLTVAEETKK